MEIYEIIIKSILTIILVSIGCVTAFAQENDTKKDNIEENEFWQ